MEKNLSAPRQLLDLFLSFAKIAVATFGGGPAMIPFVVDLAKKKEWLTDEEMVDCLTVCQSLPGGVVINMASYIGRHLRGTPGMLAGGFGVIAPAAVIAVVAGLFIGNYLDNLYVIGAIQGAKAAVVGLVFAAFFKLGKTILKKPVHWVIAFAVMAVVLILQISAVWVIIAGGIFGWLATIAGRKGTE